MNYFKNQTLKEKQSIIYEQMKLLASFTNNMCNEIGLKKSSAQITENYKITDLDNKQVIAIINFPEKQIANFLSEVLVLGIYTEDGVILLSPEQKVKNGTKIG